MAPKLIDDLMPKLVPLATLQRVLQNLLEEGVHIRDLRTIVESLTEAAAKTTNPAELSAHVRISLGRAIMHRCSTVRRAISKCWYSNPTWSAP